MQRLRSLAAAFVLWWIVLFWLWLWLVGQWDGIELVSAATAATIGACAALVVHAQRLVGFRFRGAWLAEAASVPYQVVVDFGIITWALVRTVVRRRPATGRFVVRRIEAGGAGPVSAGRRAFVTVAATFSPNAYVIDIDDEHDLVLLHDLVPNRGSEEPA